MAQEGSRLKQEMQAIMERISEVESELEEYKVVIEALKPLDPQRQCHRLINGVLVERNVAQVLPALSVNYEKSQKLHTALISSLKVREDELKQSFKVKN